MRHFRSIPPTLHRVRMLSRTTEQKYASRGFRPNATKGVDQPRHRCTSRIQWQMASACVAIPALNNANELVQRLLLMGNARPHSSPTSVAAAPAPQRSSAAVPARSRGRQPTTGEHAAQRGDDRRRRTQKPFGLPGRMPHVPAQHPSIDERGEIAFGRQHTGAEPGDRHQRHRRPVAEQHRHGDDDLGPQCRALGQPGDRDVDDRDPLEDAEDGKRRPRERPVQFDGVEEQAEAEQHEPSPYHVMTHAARPAAAARQRGRHRRAHREQQEREDEVGRRPSVPRRMVERLGRRRPRCRAN